VCPHMTKNVIYFNELLVPEVKKVRNLLQGGHQLFVISSLNESPSCRIVPLDSNETNVSKWL